MSLNLQNTLNWAAPYIQGVPMTSWIGGEPALTIASMIRNSMLSAPLTWFFNRNEVTFSTVLGQQDYTVATMPDLAFVETVSLTDDQGNIYTIKDVYNNLALAVSAFQQRPSAMSVESSSIIASVLNYKLRFLGVPDQIYTVTVTYQKLAPQFGPFFISAAANASGGNTVYTGTFDTISFPVGATAIISGFKTNAANNGSFTVVSVTATTLTVANTGGVAETIQAYASNYAWDPIPDQYSDVYNNLFVSECLAIVDDTKAQQYRQRGVAALLSKASGLTEMQKNAFAQQWLARDVERASVMGSVQHGLAGRAV
jgi:hypothetical protein